MVSARERIEEMANKEDSLHGHGGRAWFAREAQSALQACSFPRRTDQPIATTPRVWHKRFTESRRLPDLDSKWCCTHDIITLFILKNQCNVLRCSQPDWLPMLLCITNTFRCCWL